VPVLAANLHRIAVLVPEGDHEVLIAADRRPFRWGALGSLLALLVLGVMLWRGRSKIEKMELRFYLDAETGEPHIYEHGVSKEEVSDVLRDPGENRSGREGSWVAIGATDGGRLLRVVYSPDPGMRSAFVITAYDLRGKPLAAYRRRQRKKKQS
jgi:hypothetical protein